MPRTCTICKHDQRAAIERLMARGKSLRDIAGQFSVSKSAVERHQECVSDILDAARRKREIKTAINVTDEINQACVTMRKLRVACEDYLADPDNPDRFTLEARAGEIMVIFEELEAGADKPTRKKATLSNLLLRVEKALPGVVIERTESRYADPRKLVIDTMRQMTAQLDVIAKLQGLYKQPAANPLDRKAELDMLIEAIQDRAVDEGHPMPSRAECLAEILQQPKVFESVFDLAKQEMASEAIQ